MTKSKVVVLVEPIHGFNKAVINPGDKVYTFTQVYGTGTQVRSGTFLGVVRSEPNRWGYTYTRYVIERSAGVKRTYMCYAHNIAPITTTLADIDGCRIG